MSRRMARAARRNSFTAASSGDGLDVRVLHQDQAAAESIEVAAQPRLLLAGPERRGTVPFGDRAVAADELAGVLPLHVAGRGEQRLEVGADRCLALVALAPEVRALGVPELAIVGEGIDDAVDVTSREGVGDLVQALERDVDVSESIHAP